METLAINASKNARAKVNYLVADIFDWHPGRRFDTVAFAFWLSHVPELRFENFWRNVAEWLEPGGRALFVDNRAPEHYWHRKTRRQTDATYDYDRGTSKRILTDGRSYQIVKVFRDPGGLRNRLSTIGWLAQVERTEVFIFGTATQGAVDEARDQ